MARSECKIRSDATFCDMVSSSTQAIRCCIVEDGSYRYAAIDNTIQEGTEKQRVWSLTKLTLWQSISQLAFLMTHKNTSICKKR